MSARPENDLLVLAPLRIEARALRLGLASTTVARSGMGARASSRTAKKLTEQLARPVAVAGFCGALQPGLRPGDVVVASEVRGPGGVVRLPSAAAVAQALRRGGLTVHVGPMVSTDRVVYGAARARLARDGAMAVDMESYWLLESHPGQACVVRVVLDGPRVGPVRNSLASWIRAYRSLKRVGKGLEVWAGALGPRTIVVAAPRSFCTGVKRAIESTEEALELHGAPVYLLHEIVHNTHVVNSFRERGVIFVPDITDVPEGETVIFSAHGVGQAVRDKAESRCLRVIDATCPLVARVHAKAKSFAQRGHHIILIGKKGHDEVEGVMGEAPEAIHLVEGLEDIEQLHLDGGRDIAVLTQTTLIPHQVENLIRALKERLPELIVPDGSDICYASQNRQAAVRRVAPSCDFMLVLGSPNSSNSKRLVEEATRTGTPSRLVDDESEVDLSWLAGVRTLGLTAGASAPESLLESILAFVATLGPTTVCEETTESEETAAPTSSGVA